MSSNGIITEPGGGGTGIAGTAVDPASAEGALIDLASEVAGILGDSAIASTITRDSELAAHTATADAHHARYTDAEAQAVADTQIATHAGNASAHHSRYLDSEAVAAMGVKGDANPLNHDRYTDAEADSRVAAGIATHAGDADAHHTRYTDAEALAALPGTTKGDLLVHNGTELVRVGVGSNGQRLEADSTQASGVKWATVVAGGGGTTQGTGATNYNIRAANEGTVVGNARGEHSVDLSTRRVTAAQVASGMHAVLGGGYACTASGISSTVPGGQSNVASGNYSYAAGYQSTASQQFAGALSGDTTTASGQWAVACGGDSCTSSAFNTFVGGGLGVTATANYASAMGGLGNDATGQYSIALGGLNCTASGQFAMAGGDTCLAPGDWSFAFGEDCEAGFTAAQDHAFALGRLCKAYASQSFALGEGARTFAAGSIAHAQDTTDGGVQTETIPFTVDTSDATKTTATTYIGANNSAFRIELTVWADTQNANDGAEWDLIRATWRHDVTASLQRDPGTGIAPDSTYTTNSKTPTGWSVDVEVSSGGTLTVSVNGEAGTNIRWGGRLVVKQTRNYT